MKRPPWMTPGEHRLALALLLLTLAGVVLEQWQRLDPGVEAWLREPLPEAVRVAPDPWPSNSPRPDPTPVDPNHADEMRLQGLPGVGPALAKRIVEHRPYHNARDLLRVPGIGEITLRKMQSLLVFGDTTALGHSAQTSEKP